MGRRKIEMVSAVMVVVMNSSSHINNTELIIERNKPRQKVSFKRVKGNSPATQTLHQLDPGDVI
jgi:hypothetical protein